MRFHFAADATRANTERIGGKPKLFTQLAASLDLFLLLSLIVRKNQFAVAGREFFQAAIQAVEHLFLILRVSICKRIRCFQFRQAGCRDFVQTELAAFAMADIFQENKLRCYVTIVRGREISDCAFFLELLRDAGERFVRQVVSIQAVFAIKISDQPAVHLQIFFAI